MVQSALLFNNAEVPVRSISPLLEMGAYELLWSQKGASFKNIADRLKSSPDALVSDLVDHSEARDMAQKVLHILATSGITKFGVRINRAGQYPLKLRHARNPVELLYYRGIWELVETPCIAIVGTRKPSPEGLAEARALTAYLTKENWTIVSGLAEGIDSIAHKTAIEHGGKTIAVVGTPLGEVYPPGNAELQDKIAKDYLLISQVPVYRYTMQDFRRNRWFFPERNITMSALTEATVIVEAGNTSGTLIQARAAVHQKRKLFILDRCFQNPELTWPSYYEERGAIRVKTFSQILRTMNRDHQTSSN